MLRQHLIVARYVAAVEVGDAKVEQDIKQVSEVKNGEILPVKRVTKPVLNLQVNAEIPERLHQQVKKKQEYDILDEAVLHLFVRLRTQK